MQSETALQVLKIIFTMSNTRDQQVVPETTRSRDGTSYTELAELRAISAILYDMPTPSKTLLNISW